MPNCHGFVMRNLSRQLDLGSYKINPFNANLQK